MTNEVSWLPEIPSRPVGEISHRRAGGSEMTMGIVEQRVVSITNFATQMEQLANMTMRDAFQWGCDKNKFEDGWSHCSPTVYLKGLVGCLGSAVELLHAGSVSRLTKSLLWHWMAKCQTTPVLRKCREKYATVLDDVTKTVHSDLDKRVKEANSYSFIAWERLSGKGRTSIYGHREAFGTLRSYADSLGIDVDDFVQIGLGWSLSTSGEFAVRANTFWLPELDKILSLAEKRSSELDEICLILKYRELKADGTINDTVTLNGVTVLTR